MLIEVRNIGFSMIYRELENLIRLKFFFSAKWDNPGKDLGHSADTYYLIETKDRKIKKQNCWNNFTFLYLNREYEYVQSETNDGGTFLSCWPHNPKGKRSHSTPALTVPVTPCCVNKSGSCTFKVVLVYIGAVVSI